MTLNLITENRGVTKILQRLSLVRFMTKRTHTFKNIVVEDGLVSEGSAIITVPKGEVFYNPVQQFNRDLSISVISAFQDMYLAEPKLMKRFPVCEFLS